MSLRAAMLCSAIFAIACPGVPRPLERPRVQMKSLTAKQHTGGALHLPARFQVTNPNDFALTAQALDWELSIHNTRIWRARAHLNQHVAGKETVSFALVLQIPAAALRAHLSSRNLTYHFHGVLHLMGEHGDTVSIVDELGELLWTPAR